jgi:homopolymeric O-antigen transport system ATP-binding protein
MKPAIRVDNLSKHYRLGERQRGYKTLRETIADAVKAPFRRFRGQRSEVERQKSADFWALKDVSFEVQPGEVVGIIGRNGAGKSTLLKILSRITEPTSGRIELRGRVGSLLEVGTGFHPELTGRENIYMNGSILGMSQREITRKFDEIVDFAEIEDFLDTPVKRYSSGMYVRLAFAVAANLEPEILIVDEVLAVGDQSFQRKCMGKMQSVASEGRAVLFVSHHLGVLEKLCHRGVVLQMGELAHDSPISTAVGHYVSSISEAAAIDLSQRKDRRGTGELQFREIWTQIGDGQPVNSLAMGRPADFIFVLNEVRKNIDIQFTIYDQRGIAVTNMDSWRSSDADMTVDDAGTQFICRVDQLPLRAGRYYITAQITHNRELHDYIEGAIFFEVENGEYCGRSIPYPSVPGFVCIDHTWLCPNSDK